MDRRFCGGRVQQVVRAYLFDLGGTLVAYDVGSWPAALRRSIMAAYDFLVQPRDEQHPETPLPPAHVAHVLRSRAGWHFKPLAYRVGLAIRRMIRSISAHTLPQLAEALTRPTLATGRLYPDAVPTLEALRKRGFKIGLVSNTPWGTPDYLWRRQVERLGLAPYFDVQLFSSAIGWHKPHERIFAEALSRLKCRAGETVFVGDNYPIDIQGAKAAGMTAVWINRQGKVAPEAGPRADRVIISLAELLAD